MLRTSLRIGIVRFWLRWRPRFLSSNAQDFIEEFSREVCYNEDVGFLSSNAQDFIEDPGPEPSQAWPRIPEQ